MDVSAVLPLLVTTIVKTAVSPTPGKLSPLSTSTPVFTTSTAGSTVKSMRVSSSTKFPSASFPSSLTSVTSPVLPGLFAVTLTVFKIHPDPISAVPIV